VTKEWTTAVSSTNQAIFTWPDESEESFLIRLRGHDITSSFHQVFGIDWNEYVSKVMIAAKELPKDAPQFAEVDSQRSLPCTCVASIFMFIVTHYSLCICILHVCMHSSRSCYYLAVHQALHAQVHHLELLRYKSTLK
jgi:hypothetical protein